MDKVEKIGTLEIKVIGKAGNFALTPDNYDIKHVAHLLQNVEDLLYPSKKRIRPLITYDIKEGSIIHIFKTPIQYIIGFTAILNQVNNSNSVDFLDMKMASAIENMQDLAIKNNYEFLFSTSVQGGTLLSINTSSKFFRTEAKWVDAEFYFYGTLKNAGGKNKANIHIDTIEYGYLSIEVSKEYLLRRKGNLLYKEIGVRAIGKQDPSTGEIDTQHLKLLELIEYNPTYNPDYLAALINKANNTWKDINTEDWLFEVRGSYET